MNINQWSKEGFKIFADEANERSTPSVYDGLKPVHRRILYWMHENKATSSKPFMSSAKVVGGVLGQYHPHGDASVYDAAVRLSQNFKLRYPLIDFHGNGGSIVEDGYAASRYTKMKLTKLGDMLFNDIEKDTVPFMPNYNEECLEPTRLTASFPNLLCNGSLGIGVGLSSNMLPHNLNEVVAAIKLVLNNPSAGVEDILTVLKGPDFPTGGVLVDVDKIKDVYTAGKGTLRVRARYHIEPQDGRNHIVITEIPYLINLEDKIIGSIKKLAIDGYEAIYDIVNNTGKNGLEIRIILEKGTNPHRVLEHLFENTGLQTTLKINNTVNYGEGQFRTLSVRQLIGQYLQYQHDIIIKAAKYDLEKFTAQKHLLEGLIIAINNIDEVIHIIKNSKDRASAALALTQKFGLTEPQTKYVLDTKLARLTSLEVEDLKQSIIELENKMNACKDRISNAKLRDSIIDQNLTTLSNLFGDERRTTLSVSEFSQLDDRNVLLMLKDDRLVAYAADAVKRTNKGAKGSSISKDAIDAMTGANTKDTVYGISAAGFAYRIPMQQLNIAEDLKDIGSLITDVVELPKEEKIIGFAKLDFTKQYLITISKNGIIKKSLVSDYKELKRSNKLCRIKANDSLMSVFCANNEDFLLVYGDNEKILKIPVKDIKVNGRETYGAKGTACNTVISAAVGSNTDIALFAGSEGKGKKVLVSEIPEGALKGTGVVCGKDSAFYIAAPVQHYSNVIITGTDNKSINLDLSDIAQKSFKSEGVKIYNGKIAKITLL